LNSVDCNIVDPYQELEEYCLLGVRLGKPKGEEGKISSSSFSFFLRLTK
jgi:hypothetical protein